MSKKFDLVMPIIERDMQVLEKTVSYLWTFLPIKRIVLIGNEEVSKRLLCNNMENTVFINENDVIPFEAVRSCIAEASDNSEKAIKRTGWYYQQFLKMAYALQCHDEYYLLWDGDTVPLHPVEMISKDKPYFDMKTEFYPYYFETMEKLLGLKKVTDFSFIAEHMIISVELMQSLISQIQENTRVAGETFYEKIIFSVNKEQLHFSGFSEFETYGTFVQTKYLDSYELREWKSLREGSKYFDIDHFNIKDVTWLAKQYDAISFEKTMDKIPEYRLYSVGLFRVFFGFDELKSLNLRIRGFLHNIKHRGEKK